MTEPIAVSVKQAAELLNIGPTVIYAAVNDGTLPAKRLPSAKSGRPGTAIRINVTSLHEWFDALDDVREAS